MCLEDYRLGRATGSGLRVVSVGTTAVQLSSGSPNRVAVIISGPASATVTIGMDASVTSGQGIRIPAGVAPVILTLVQHGDIVRRPLYAISASGTETIGIIETYLETQ